MIHGFNLHVMIGILAITLFYWNRFNSWTEKEARFGKTRPPRQFTTWTRFTLYAFFYTLSYVIAYCLLVRSPDLMLLLVKYFQIQWSPALNQTEVGPPFWVVVIMIGFFPNTPGIRQLDEAYRVWWHQRAFIPSEAKALINHMMSNPSLFKPDIESMGKIIQEYGSSLPENWEYASDDESLTGKWFRLVYLKEKLDTWCTQPKIERFMSQCDDEHRLFLEQFVQLNLDMESWVRKRPRTGSAASLESQEMEHQLRRGIVRQIEKLADRLYEFVVCGVLTTEKIHDRRMSDLGYFGLYPDYSPGIPVVLDIVLQIAVFSMGIVGMTSAAYFWYNHMALGQPFSLIRSLQWSVVVLLIIGLSISMSVVVYRMIAMKSRFRNNANAIVIGPFVHQFIGFMVGYLSGFVVLYLFILMMTKDGGALNSAVKTLPWPLVPAIISGFVVYYLATLSQERRRSRDAAVLSFCTIICGVISCFLASSIQEKTLSLSFFIFTICSSGGIGAVIGWIFPSGYSQYRLQTTPAYRGIERRKCARMNVATPVMLGSGAMKLNGQTLDLSEEGACLAVSGDTPVGDQVRLTLVGIGDVESQVVRRQGKTTAVSFQADSELISLLRTGKRLAV